MSSKKSGNQETKEEEIEDTKETNKPEETKETDEIKETKDQLNQFKSPNDLTFHLEPNLKTDAMNCITTYLTIIDGQKIEGKNKEELINLNNYVLKKLSTLSFNEKGNDLNELALNKLDLTKVEASMFFELKFSTRKDIVSLFMKNYSLICSFSKPLSDEEKRNLIEENNRLFTILLNLNPKIGDKELVDARIMARPTKDSKVSDQFEYLMAKTDQLEAKLKEIDTRSPQTTFTFIVDNVEEFLKNEKEMCSEYFFVNSVQWSVVVKSNFVENDTKYVSVFIYPVDFELDHKSEYCSWRIKASFKVKLLHWSDDTLSKSHSFENKIFSRNNGFGKYKFVSYETINIFTRNDKIMIQVQIKTDRLYKCKEIIKLEADA